jgi:7-keto-8-aminopelargonate synthetase-like enzyme
MLRPISSALAVIAPASDRPDEMLRLIAVNTDWPGPAGMVRPGLDFATQDYLSLASQPAITGTSAPHMSGNTAVAFEARLANFLQLPSAALFPSGNQAIRQTLGTLLRPEDDVIVDAASDPAMFETVLQARATLHRSPSASVEGVERRLARLARRAHRGQLFIAAPAVSANGSRIADLADLTQLARHYGAMLIVDATHDLGAMGPAGGGVLEIQGCAGRADIVLGSLAPTFASHTGFAAFRNPAHRAAVARAAGEAPEPALDASKLHAALDLIASPEGHRRRRHLHRLGLRLRNHLMSDGIRVMGQASPFVPLLLPVLSALPRTALLESAGPRVTLLQAPVVPLHAPRWRIQLTAAHSPADIDDLAELIRDVSRAFDRRPTRTYVPA